jgi:hypothetical protein
MGSISYEIPAGSTARAEIAKYIRYAALGARGRLIKLVAPVTLRSEATIATVCVESLRLWKTQSGLRIRPDWDWFVSNWQLLPQVKPVEESVVLRRPDVLSQQRRTTSSFAQPARRDRPVT